MNFAQFSVPVCQSSADVIKCNVFAFDFYVVVFIVVCDLFNDKLQKLQDGNQISWVLNLQILDFFKTWVVSVEFWVFLGNWVCPCKEGCKGKIVVCNLIFILSLRFHFFALILDKNLFCVCVWKLLYVYIISSCILRAYFYKISYESSGQTPKLKRFVYGSSSYVCFLGKTTSIRLTMFDRNLTF